LLPRRRLRGEPPPRAAPAVPVHSAAPEGGGGGWRWRRSWKRQRSRGRGGGERGGGEGGGVRGVRDDLRCVRRVSREGREAAPGHPRRRRRRPWGPRAGRLLPGLHLGEPRALCLILSVVTIRNLWCVFECSISRCGLPFWLFADDLISIQLTILF
jgi:hypothetical protein